VGASDGGGWRTEDGTADAPPCAPLSVVCCLLADPPPRPGSPSRKICRRVADFARRRGDKPCDGVSRCPGVGAGFKPAPTGAFTGGSAGVADGGSVASARVISGTGGDGAAAGAGNVAGIAGDGVTVGAVAGGVAGGVADAGAGAVPGVAAARAGAAVSAGAGVPDFADKSCKAPSGVATGALTGFAAGFGLRLFAPGPEDRLVPLGGRAILAFSPSFRHITRIFRAFYRLYRQPIDTVR
jgi:hypothetical protein